LKLSAVPQLAIPLVILLVRNGGVDPGTGKKSIIKIRQVNRFFTSFYVPAGQFQWSNPDGTQYKENGVAVGVTQAKDGVMYGNTIPNRLAAGIILSRIKDLI